MKIGIDSYSFHRFMGKTHTNALRTRPYVDWPGVVRPELVAIAGRTEERVREAAAARRVPPWSVQRNRGWR